MICLKIGDKTYSDLTDEQKQIALSNGISVNNINNRLRIGWDIKKVITYPVDKTKSVKRLWTSDEEDQLARLYEDEGMKVREIAVILGRNYHSVTNKKANMGLFRELDDATRKIMDE